MTLSSHQEVLAFWFEELSNKQWWVKDPELDREITERFADLHAAAARCELFAWRQSAPGRLAEVIVLDQFSRNMFRDTADSFAYDPLALALAQEAVAAGADTALDPGQRSFLYMPYMHSESLLIHDVAVQLFTKNGVQSSLDFEFKHRRIIERFGRYPHRNDILGRKSSPQELEFLSQPGSGF